MITASVPVNQSEITSDWMTAALAGSFPGVAVCGLRESMLIDGTAQKIRFELEFFEGRRCGAPSSLWIKGGFDPKGASQGEAFANEVRFFRDIAPMLTIERPACFYGAVDDRTRNGVVLLEDLTRRDAVFGDARRPLAPDATAAVLSVQAQYHARFWKGENLGGFPWLKAGGAIGESDMVDQFFGLWDAAVPLPRFGYLSKDQRRRPRMQAALNTLVRLLKEEAICLIHGDSGVPNIYFDGAGRAGYLDWQHVMRGHWAFDVAALVVTSLTVSDRRAHERDLLKHYLAELAANGAEVPSFDAAWRDYRRFSLWPFMWVMCPPTVHPEEVCSLLAERAAIAADDLEAVESLTSA